MADVEGALQNAELVGTVTAAATLAGSISAGSVHIHDYTITVTTITGGHRLTVTQTGGSTQTMDIMDGEDGEDGKGIASTVLNADYTLTITYTDGTSYTTGSIRGEKGDKGDTGEPGTTTWAGITDKPSTFPPSAHTHVMDDITDLPETLITKISAGTGINTDTTSGEATIALSSEAQTSIASKLTKPSSGIAVGKYFRVASLDSEGNPVLEMVDAKTIGVQDVQVGGSSVLVDGVANILFAAENIYGVVKPRVAYGLKVVNGYLAIEKATNTNIDLRNQYKPIDPSNFDYALKAALSDSNRDTTYTDAQKAAACDTIGAVRDAALASLYDETVTYETATTHTINLESCDAISLVITAMTGASVGNYGIFVITKGGNAYDTSECGTLNATTSNTHAMVSWYPNAFPVFHRWGTYGAYSAANVRHLFLSSRVYASGKITKIVTPPLTGSFRITVYGY